MRLRFIGSGLLRDNAQALLTISKLQPQKATTGRSPTGHPAQRLHCTGHVQATSPKLTKPLPPPHGLVGGGALWEQPAKVGSKSILAPGRLSGLRQIS